jgi:hypothetical protein
MSSHGTFGALIKIFRSLKKTCQAILSQTFPAKKKKKEKSSTFSQARKLENSM